MRNIDFVERLAAIAQDNGATVGQIALARLLAQRSWIAPIPSTGKVQRMVENVAASAIVLSDADLRRIEAALAAVTIEGALPAERSCRFGDNTIAAEIESAPC